MTRVEEIERDMRDADPTLQWAMNETLATIGIEDDFRRARAIEIGEQLQVLADYRSGSPRWSAAARPERPRIRGGTRRNPDDQGGPGVVA